MDESPFYKRPWFIAFCLFALVFAFGLRFMSAGLVHYDSIALAKVVTAAHDTGDFQGISTGRYGMVALVFVTSTPLQWFGYDVDFAIRFTGVLFLALCAAALYLLAYGLMRSRIGAMASSLLLVVTPLFVIPATYGKEHSPALFLIIAAFYAVLKGHQGNKAWSIAAPVLFVLSLTIRELGIVVLPAFIWFVLLPRFHVVDGKRKIVLAQHWIEASIALVVSLVIVLVSFLFDSIVAMLGDTATAGMTLTVRVWMFALELLRHTGGEFPVALLGCYALWRMGRRFLVPILLWLAPLAIIVTLGGFLPRYLDIVLVPYVLLVGFAIAWLSHKTTTGAVIVLVILVLSTFALAYPFLEFRHQQSNLAEFSRYVASVTEPGSIIIAMDEGAFLEWYGNRTGTSISPTIENKDAVARALVQAQRQGKRFYVLSSCFDYPQGPALKSFLIANFNTTRVGSAPMENYHDAEEGLYIRNVSIYKIGEPRFTVNDAPPVNAT